MGVDTKIYVVKKDGTSLEVGTVFTNIQKAVLNTGAFSTVNVLGKKGFNPHMSTSFSTLGLISACTVYYAHPKGDTVFRDLSDGLKYEAQGLRLLYAQHKFDGDVKATPQEIVNAAQFVQVTLGYDEIAVDFLSEVAKNLTELLPDHHVYFLEKTTESVFQKFEQEEAI